MRSGRGSADEATAAATIGSLSGDELGLPRLPTFRRRVVNECSYGDVVTRVQVGALAFGVIVHLTRFGVILLGLWLAPLLGIAGWYAGLFANVLCALYAAALVTWLGLWRSTGFLTLWRGKTPALLSLILLAEALIWLMPRGLAEQPPGYGLWALTLLLVGFNEELISRGVVLSRIGRAFSAIPAVTFTALLFGMQHLSAFATSTRDTYDVLGNVLVSACYGFALGAFQYKFAWIWPLMLIHALADFTTILTVEQHGEVVIVVTLIAFVGFGFYLLTRAGPASPADG